METELQKEMKKLLNRGEKDKFLKMQMEPRHFKKLKSKGEYSFRSFNPNINKTKTITIKEGYWDASSEEWVRKKALQNLSEKAKRKTKKFGEFKHLMRKWGAL